MIYVVDSADRDRIGISKQELVSMLEVRFFFLSIFYKINTKYANLHRYLYSHGPLELQSSQNVSKKIKLLEKPGVKLLFITIFH